MMPYTRTLLPLAMVGAAVWWLMRLAARADLALSKREGARGRAVDG